MKLLIVPLLLLAVAVASLAQTAKRSKSPAYRSIEQKLDTLARNGAASQPRPMNVDITSAEADAWINEGGVKLPAGISNVHFTSTSRVITTNAKIDFDKLTADKQSMNPLLMLFTGIHDVVVVANAWGTGGVGEVKVNSMSIDGVNVPRSAMEFFVNRYLKPKYPNVGLDTRFQFPARIDSAVVGNNKVTLTQK